jgi:NAD(P)-dependent dehydrogenase (short-subunit alcohol dehydrogenase family)
VLHETWHSHAAAEAGLHDPQRVSARGFTPHDDHDGSAEAGHYVREEPVRESALPQLCYVCKQKYTVIHHFYDQMCPECAEFNFAKRTELADLRGRVALLTGGRVKIGYQAGLKLLRCGAHLIVTTRFPRDSAARYAKEPDFSEWGHRLEVYGLDLRHTPSVEAFCHELLTTRDRLDFIINNACQTVRRPPDFYAHMMDGETQSLHDMPEHVRKLLGSYEGLRAYHMLPARPVRGAFTGAAPARGACRPERSLSPGTPRSGSAADRSPGAQLLAPVAARGSSVELLEVQLVNAVAPFIINARLKALMLRTAERDKHIVNVSAMEGQFYRNFKTTRHPHTNMAKAALNMMTRTSATDYQPTAFT